MLYTFPNLVSKVGEFSTPWSLAQGRAVPPEIIPDKVARGKWIQDSRTQHVCYSAFEGLSAVQRIDKSNYVCKMRAVVADYDSPYNPEQVAERLAKCEWTPSYYEVSLSGKVRLIWLLETPALIFPDHCERVLKRIAKAMKLADILAGFDKPAFLNPAQIYTAGTTWFQLSGAPVPNAVMIGWIMEAEKDADKNPSVIPWDELGKEVAARFPNRWPGEFREGAQGPRFWDPLADAPLAAIVRPTGMRCFTGEKPFMSWAEIFGMAFVERFQAQRIGAAVARFWYDGKQYWRTVNDGSWMPFSKDDLTTHLRIAGLSPRGDCSEIHRAVGHIQDNRNVHGAGPFVFMPPGVMKYYGKPVLNTSTVMPMAPAESPQVWGENFPWLAAFFDALLRSDLEKDTFLAWFRRIYASALAQNPQQGQALFLAGDAGQGKTFLSHHIISPALGGHAECNNFMTGGTRFNEELFRVGLWTIDDGNSTVDARSHAMYSSIIKRMAANTQFSYEAKFRTPCQVSWAGRVVVTLNLDAESLRLLPDVSTSMLDKILLLQVETRADRFNGNNPVPIVQTELPFFLRWLLDWTPPAEVMGDVRYGVKALHNQDLLNSAKASSGSSTFIELVAAWAKRHFKDGTCPPWVGTATELLSVMTSDNPSSPIYRGIDVKALGRALGQIQNQSGHLTMTNEVCREWTIYPDVIATMGGQQPTLPGSDPENEPF